MKLILSLSAFALLSLCFLNSVSARKPSSDDTLIKIPMIAPLLPNLEESLGTNKSLRGGRTPLYKKVQVEGGNMSKIVANLRKSLCPAVQKGVIRTWISVDASGKLFGVGAATNGGIEVRIECGEPSASTKAGK